jgi:hypothetical protein
MGRRSLSELCPGATEGGARVRTPPSHRPQLALERVLDLLTGLLQVGLGAVGLSFGLE